MSVGTLTVKDVTPSLLHQGKQMAYILDLTPGSGAFAYFVFFGIMEVNGKRHEGGTMNRRTAGIALGTIMMLMLSGNLALPQDRHQGDQGRRDHPRIYAAISGLEDAIAYMESSRDDFGGHKRAALRSSRNAVRELQAALRYQDRRDHRNY